MPLTRRTLLSLTGQCLAAAAAERVFSFSAGAQGLPGDHIGPTASASVLPNAKDSIKFAVLGDTGTGGREQYQIGKLVSDARTRFHYDFVTMMGDNMYGGQGPSDFVKKFETPYKSILDANVPFYATLGNHDDPAQRFYKLFNMDGKRYYSFRKGDVVTFHIAGHPLELGKHRFEIEVFELNMGRLHLAFDDTLSRRPDGLPTDLP